MRSSWNQAEALRHTTDLQLRVYTSRLLGGEPSLVLHGGGNTSVKTSLRTASGREEEVLCVKGSGADLARVTEDDFTPVRLNQVQRLIALTGLDNQGLTAAVSNCVTEPGRPRPSIETLLHAVLPFRFVEHTHADSVLAITNTADGARIAAAVFGALAPLVPFHHSGFALARACHEVYRSTATPATIGLILLHHGVFAFGNSARESYENMLRLVTLAEDYLKRQAAWILPGDDEPESWTPAEVARLRCDISRAAGFPLVLKLQSSAQCRAFARRADLAELCSEGPATPQHAVFAKRVPMLGRDVARYVSEYTAYVASHRPGEALEDLRLDPAPRVIIDPRLGVWTAGMDAHHAGVTGEIFLHDLEIKTRAAAHDRYVGRPPNEILDAEVHYGGFEWRMRQRRSDDIALLGEIALVAGPDDELGRQIAHALLQRGAAVGLVNQANAQWPSQEAILALNATPSAQDSTAALGRLVGCFGGLDALVLRPGFEAWLPVCAELLGVAPRGGRVVLVGPSDWCDRIHAGAERLAAQQRVSTLRLVVESDALGAELLVTASTTARLCAAVPTPLGTPGTGVLRP